MHAYIHYTCTFTYTFDLFTAEGGFGTLSTTSVLLGLLSHDSVRLHAANTPDDEGERLLTAT